MKLKPFYLLFCALVAVSCSKEDGSNSKDNPIMGNWKPKTLTWENENAAIEEVSLSHCQQHYSMLKFGEDHKSNFELFPYNQDPDDCYRTISSISGAWVENLENQYFIYYQYFNIDPETNERDYDNPQNGVFEFEVSFPDTDIILIHQQDLLGYFTELLPEEGVTSFYVTYERATEW